MFIFKETHSTCLHQGVCVSRRCRRSSKAPGLRRDPHRALPRQLRSIWKRTHVGSLGWAFTARPEAAEGPKLFQIFRQSPGSAARPASAEGFPPAGNVQAWDLPPAARGNAFSSESNVANVSG